MYPRESYLFSQGYNVDLFLSAFVFGSLEAALFCSLFLAHSFK